MSKDPAFMLYSSDFIVGTITMTDEEVGKYIRLLCIQHQHGGLIDKRTFTNLVSGNSNIISKFIETEDGFYNERLMSEMVKRQKKSNNLSINALIRWNKAKQMQCKCNANEDAGQMPTVIEDENVISIESMKEGVLGEGSETKYSDSFEEFWKLYPKKIGKGAAYKLWKRINPSNPLLEKIVNAVKAQCKSAQWQKENGQFIPNPATWLNQERWNDELKNSGVGNKYEGMERDF